MYALQSAAVCIDNDNGYVRAIVGGRSQDFSGYTLNRAFQSYRQPGSAIKPLIVYTPSFERNYTPDSVVTDEPIEDGPRNANGSYSGQITVRTAVEKSVNTIAWKLYEELTPEVGLSYLEKMNFAKLDANDYRPATALGGFTNGVSALEMASGYAAIENDGNYRAPTCIVKILDADGNEIYAPAQTEEAVYKQNAARMMTDVLKGVITSGTAHGLGLGSMPAAGKTGTSIAIINLREKGKMREIERIIGKKFIAGEMPTGKQICEKQLLKVIDDLEKVKVNEEDINDFMPEIYRKLEWLSKEDLIKRMVSHEFNRFVDYYRNREEIEVPTDSRSERAGKSREGKSSRQAEPGYTRLFINLGKMDNFFPHELITLLNNNTRGRVELGRIDLMKNFSFFEVEEKQAQNVVKALNRTNWNGRKVTVEVAGEEASTEHKGRGKRNEGNDQGGRGRSSAPSADRKERGKGSKDSKQADSRKGKKPSREERGYSAARGPKGKDEWKQFFKDAEPDFSEEGWARRKPKKS